MEAGLSVSLPTVRAAREHGARCNADRVTQGSIGINSWPRGSGRRSATTRVAARAGREHQGSGGEQESPHPLGPRTVRLAPWRDGGPAPFLRTAPSLWYFQSDAVCRGMQVLAPLPWLSGRNFFPGEECCHGKQCYPCLSDSVE